MGQGARQARRAQHRPDPRHLLGGLVAQPGVRQRRLVGRHHRRVALPVERRQRLLPAGAPEHGVQRIREHRRLRQRVADARAGARVLQVRRVPRQRPAGAVWPPEEVVDAARAHEPALQLGAAQAPGQAGQRPDALLERLARARPERVELLGLDLQRDAVLARAHREDEADLVAAEPHLQGRLRQRLQAVVVAVVRRAHRRHLQVELGARPLGHPRPAAVRADDHGGPHLVRLALKRSHHRACHPSVLLDQALRPRPLGELGAGADRVVDQHGVQHVAARGQ